MEGPAHFARRCRSSPGPGLCRCHRRVGTLGWFIRAADSLSELSVFLALQSASLSFAFESLARAKNVRPHSGLSPLPFDKQPNTDYEESVDLFGPQPATQILWLALQALQKRAHSRGVGPCGMENSPGMMFMWTNLA